VVDSEDLLEHFARDDAGQRLLQKLNGCSRAVLKFLEEQAVKDPAAYDEFYSEYQRFLKEGVVTDLPHREALGRLLRFESSALEAGKRTSLAEYVSRMPAGQKEIYFLQAPSRQAAEASPYFEGFQARKFEVLFLYDPWDEFVMDHLHTFQDKPLRPPKRRIWTSDAPAGGALSAEAAADLAKWLKETLGTRSRKCGFAAAGWESGGDCG
jgi:molecular chaperone HtpG